MVGMRAVSSKRAGQNRKLAALRTFCFERDGRYMAPISWGLCEGGWHLHHIVSRARATLLLLEASNCTTLCVKHHSAAHLHPKLATDCGLMASAPGPQTTPREPVMFGRRKLEAITEAAPEAAKHQHGPYRFGTVTMPVRACQECGRVDLFFDNGSYMYYGNVRGQQTVPSQRQTVVTWDDPALPSPTPEDDKT